MLILTKNQAPLGLPELRMQELGTDNQLDTAIKNTLKYM